MLRSAPKEQPVARMSAAKSGFTSTGAAPGFASLTRATVAKYSYRTIDPSFWLIIILPVLLDAGRHHEALLMSRRAPDNGAAGGASGGAAPLARVRAPSHGARAARSQGRPKGRLSTTALAPPGAPFPIWGRKKGRRRTRRRKEYGRWSIGLAALPRLLPPGRTYISRDISHADVWL